MGLIQVFTGDRAINKSGSRPQAIRNYSVGQVIRHRVMRASDGREAGRFQGVQEGMKV
jgi:hypothetical protein